jgi:hypothetical protein
MFFFISIEIHYFPLTEVLEGNISKQWLREPQPPLGVLFIVDVFFHFYRNPLLPVD